MFPLYLAYVIWLIVPIVIWSAFWKALGLWFSARNNEKTWFIVFAFINLLGILEIYYLHSRRCWPFRRK
ncbi:MAG: DUF5652 family protein [Candidatus Bathyarchaeia archaeon]